MQKSPRRLRAFSLIELLAVVSLMALLAGIMVPAMSGLGRAGELNTATRQVANLLTVARTEAITKGARTRFAVVRDWAGQPAASFRKMSIWKFDPAQNAWVQITRWEEVPKTVRFDTNSAGYASMIPADHLTSPTATNSFTTVVNGQTVDLQFAEFSPDGGVSQPNMTGFEIWMALTASSPTQAGAPANWAKITANSLTGRIKIDRP